MIAGLVIAFTYGWKLTLVILTVAPVIGAGEALNSLGMISLSRRANEVTALASQVAGIHIIFASSNNRQVNLLEIFALLHPLPMRTMF